VIKIIFTFFSLFILSSCGGSEFYKSSYVPALDPMKTPNLILLAEDKNPLMITTVNIDEDLVTFQDQNYVVVGESAFNGQLEDPANAVKIAKEVGATHVLISTNYNYSGSKKAYKYVRTYDYVRASTNVDGYSQRYYEAIPVDIAIPYKKEVHVFKHRAVFMVKTSASVP
jgi:hypothetical protein